MKKRITALLLCLIMALSLVPTSVWAAGTVKRQVDRVRYYDSNGTLIKRLNGGNQIDVFNGPYPNFGNFIVSKDPKTYHNDAPKGTVKYYLIGDSDSALYLYYPDEDTGNKYPGLSIGHFNGSILVDIYYESFDEPAAENQTLQYQIEYRDANNEVTGEYSTVSSSGYVCQNTNTAHKGTDQYSHKIKTKDLKSIYDNASIKQGYTKTGWSKYKDSSLINTFPASIKDTDIVSDTLQKNQTIYIIAKANAPATKDITLTYNANAGTDTVTNMPDPSSVTQKVTGTNATFTISGDTPIRENYNFLGWANSADAKTPDYTAGYQLTISASKTIYAVWQQKTPQIDNPKEPTQEELEELGNLVNLWCTTERTSTGAETLKRSTKLLDGTYSVTIDPRDPYTCTVSIDKHHEYYAVLITDKTHEIDPDTNQDQNFSLEYNKEKGKWELGLDKEANLHFKCTQTSVDPIELGGDELNGLFQKNLTVTQGSTMEKAEAFTITLTNKEDSTQTVSGTTALMSASGVEPFTFTSGLTFDDKGDCTFIVKETAGSTDGMEYDKNEYRMTVKVVKDSAANALKIESITFTDSQEQPVTLVNNKLIFNNTYDKKAPATEAVLDGAALSNLFKKDLTVNETMANDEVFEIVVMDGSLELTRGKTPAMNAAVDTTKTETFTFDKPMSFLTKGTYTYTVEEVPGANTDGKMVYDTTKYTMTVVVSENTTTNALEAAVSFTPAAESDGKVTFKNTYGTKTTPPTAPTGDDLNGLVTVKCINPKVYDSAKDCSLIKYGLLVDTNYQLNKITDEKYELVLSADPFVKNYSKAGQALNRSHDLYSAEKLTWYVTCENGGWVTTPKTPGVDDTVLVTHAPTTYDEASQMSLGNINTRCKLCTTGYNAMGVISAFVGGTAANNVTVVKAEDPGAYTLTINKKLFADTLINGSANWCAHAKKLQDNKTPNPDARKYDMVGSDTATFNLTVKLENGKYVWSAVPATQADGICEITHRIKVTFDENYNNTSTDVMYKYNTAEVKEGAFPADPTREGYTFKGWNTKADGTGTAFDAKTIVTDDVTVYAQWEANALTIYYHGNGGKLENGKEQTTSNSKTDKEIAIKRNPFTRTGYTFVGWTTEKDGATIAYKGGEKHAFSASEITNGEVHFWAKWEATEYTITYVLRDRKAINNPANPATYTVEDTVTLLAPTTKSNNQFLEWRDGDGNVITKIAAGTTGDVTVYAYWKCPIKLYEITNNGNVQLGNTIYVTEGTSYPLPDGSTYAKNGYTFKCWYENGKDLTADKNRHDAVTPTVTKEWKLYGKNIPIEYTITYVLNDKDAKHTNQTTYTVEDEFAITDATNGSFGRKFLEWRDADSKTGNKVDKIKKGTTGSITLYAIWRNPVNYFQVDKDNNESLIRTDYVTVHEDYQTIAAIDKAGYTFDGWYKSTKDFGADSKKVTGFTATNSKAEWKLYGKLTPNKYTVTFDVNANGDKSAKVNPADKEVTFDAAYGELATTSRDGYNFLGWYTKEEGGTKVEVDTVVTTAGPHTLYAHWEARNDTPYKVEHYQEQLDGTYELKETENLTGTTDTTATAVPKDDYTGFTYDETVKGTVKTGTIAGDGSLVLKLYYTRNSYTVTFDSMGGSKIDDQKVKYQETATKPTDPTKSGYTFAGWYTDKKCTKGNEFSFDTKITGDITLYAKWDVKRTGTNPDAKNPYIKDNTKKDDGKTVKSGDTFDAGISLYVGLGILSLTGSAAAIYKRREEY